MYFIDSFTIKKEVNCMKFKNPKLIWPKKVVGKSVYRKNQTISEVISNTRVEDLEELVIRNFKDILNVSKSNEYYNFTMYQSWRELFCSFSAEVFEDLVNYYEFEEIIKNFPELEADVYTFLINGIINSEIDYDLLSQINIAEDLLIPMSHMESYRGVFFPQIRDSFRVILNETTTITDFYAIASALEIYYDISPEVLKEILDNYINDEINFWLSAKVDPSDFDSLINLFYHGDAYDSFMERLYEILPIHGMDLYAFLIKKIGPEHEILESQFFCYEFNVNR